MLKDRYQNSLCKENYLHNFVQVRQTKYGFLERCTRCGQTEHFPGNIPNHVYLSYHIRSALQPGEPLFHREYPNAIKD